MKADFTAGGVLALAAVGAVAFVAWKLYSNRGQLADAINPASSSNLAYRGVNAIGEAATGQPGWSLGGAVFDATHAQRIPGDPTSGVKGPIETGWDAYKDYVRRFWGIEPERAPTTGDFARLDRQATYGPAPTDERREFSDPTQYGFAI